MSQQVIIGFTTEGTTDSRFLQSVIQRSFENVAGECRKDIEILPIRNIKKQVGDFVEVVKKYSQQAENEGIMVLCVHTDADDRNDTNAFNYKINPAFTAVNDMSESNLCKNLVAIVPIHMTEAWMLSDRELLKEEIGTSKTDEELGINRSPETYPNPKEIIETAIRIAREDLPKHRRNKLVITQLYSIMGHKIALNTLESLPSYQRFKEAVREAFRKLSYLY